jgi:hypothetical protein
MIVIVPLKNYNHNENLIERAFAAWHTSRLLKDTDFRNRFKYFVVRQGDEILEIYCIKAIAPYTDNPVDRTVKFLLEPVSYDCFKFIKIKLDNIKKDNPKYYFAQGRRYILEEDLAQYGHHISIECDCGIEHIQVLEPNDIRFSEQIKTKSSPREYIHKN